METIGLDYDSASDICEDKHPNYLDHTVWSFLNDMEDERVESVEDHEVPSTWHPRKSLDSAVPENPTPASPVQTIDRAHHVFPMAHLVSWINGALARGSGCVAFLCGATCSGKTSSAQLTAQHFKARAFVVSSDLQYGMTGKTARDAIAASLAQYASQLERAKQESVAILFDGMHLQPEDTREKLHMAFFAGIPLENIGWFVADQKLEEDDEVQMLMTRQQQRFTRFWNTGSSSTQQGDAKIVPPDQVRAMVRKLRATFLPEGKALVKWDDARLLGMISEADANRVVKQANSRRSSADLSYGDLVAIQAQQYLTPTVWPAKEVISTELLHPITVGDPAMWAAQQAQLYAIRAPLPYGVGPMIIPFTDGHMQLDASGRCDAVSIVGPSPGPSCGPSPADSPFASMQSPMHSLDTSPTISPTTPGRKAMIAHLLPGPGPEPPAPSLSHILKANAIHSARPLTPPRNAQPSPSPATLSAVAAIVSTLHNTLNLKNAQAAASGQGSTPTTPAAPTPSAPPAGATKPPVPGTKSPPTKESPGNPKPAVDLRRNSAPVGLMPYPLAPVCPDRQPVPKELQGLLPTPPQVIIRPEMYGMLTSQEGSTAAGDAAPPRARSRKQSLPPPAPTQSQPQPAAPPTASPPHAPPLLVPVSPKSAATPPEVGIVVVPKSAKNHRRHSTSQYLP